jgi:hypothetical protein
MIAIIYHDLDRYIAPAATDAEELSVSIRIDNAWRAATSAGSALNAMAALISAFDIRPGARRAINDASITAILTTVISAVIVARIAAIFAQIRAGPRIQMPDASIGSRGCESGQGKKSRSGNYFCKALHHQASGCDVPDAWQGISPGTCMDFEQAIQDSWWQRKAENCRI